MSLGRTSLLHKEPRKIGQTPCNCPPIRRWTCWFSGDKQKQLYYVYSIICEPVEWQWFCVYGTRSAVYVSAATVGPDAGQHWCLHDWNTSSNQKKKKATLTQSIISTWNGRETPRGLNMIRPRDSVQPSPCKNKPNVHWISFFPLFFFLFFFFFCVSHCIYVYTCPMLHIQGKWENPSTAPGSQHVTRDRVSLLSSLPLANYPLK